MPAINDIFGIHQITHTHGTIKATLGINTQSEIFKGHFPDQPVVPGACMLQIVKDVLESALNNTIRLKKADHLKFISMIVPSLNDMAELDIIYKPIAEGSINVTAKLIASDVICFKFQGNFVEVI